MHARYILFLFVLAAAQLTAAPAPTAIEFDSGSHRVALIELYTSEGCSSCPPADRWLSRLDGDGGLWRDYVPVAFHVDYWDYIGWQDRFASADFSARQRRYAAEGGVRVVYTPGVFLDGKEWRGWQRGYAPTTRRGRAGDLSVTVDGDRVTVHFDGPGDDRLLVHVALLGMRLETEVRAGENRGRRLRHDFVALDVESAPLAGTTGDFAATLPMPASDIDAPETALVAWVSTARAQAPLQAVGGRLPN